MKNREIGSLIKFSLPRAALLLYAIAPVTESKDWIFYIISTLIIGLFIASIICAVLMWKKSRKDFIEYVLGRKQDNLYDIMIAIAGFIVSYSMDAMNYSYFWCFVLIFAIMELIYPFRLNNKNT